MNLGQFKIENNHLLEVDYVVKLIDEYENELLSKSFTEQMVILSSAVNKDFKHRKVILNRRNNATNVEKQGECNE